MVFQTPEVAVVDFHHARGPEIEFWITTTGAALAARNDWSLLPFMALSDGAHASMEDFSYFTLLSEGNGNAEGAKEESLFGIACTRQINAKKLMIRSAEVTRSTVQKAVVVVFGMQGGVGGLARLRERVGVVTGAWFGQEDFTNIKILEEFQESLVKGATLGQGDDGDQSFGLSLREMIHEFKHQTLVLFKCLLLQRKMLFFGSRCERLCMMQFALISLIPGLFRCLEDCADPRLDSYAKTVTKATSLRTSDRNSLHAYMGLPLQIFGKGSLFSPYTPLQSLDLLAAESTKSYLVGSTNSLLLQQKDKYADVLVNLDDTPTPTITISSPTLRAALALSPADRRWIDFLTQTVNDTWDPDNPNRPKTLGYAGSEEFIRLQFEEYLLALLSCTSYRMDHEAISSSNPPSQPPPQADPSTDPTTDFTPDFLTAWSTTPNHGLWSSLTSQARIYDITEPRHPTAGGLSVEDIQRRLAQQVAELHLDEKMNQGREIVNRHLATGREKFGRLWAEVEARRMGRKSGSRSRSRSRNRGDNQTQQHQQGGVVFDSATNDENTPPTLSPTTTSTPQPRASAINMNIDTAQLVQTATAARDNAGAYIASWGSWARERAKKAQQRSGGDGVGGGGGGGGGGGAEGK